MPTLTWNGKEEAVEAKDQVPYHLLEEDPALGYGDADAGNVIVQGDNLAALKALLPYYKGRVRCIYADPPYNTGSAFEHYDDNVEHSTWLSLMYPRLELMREFLSEDGTIWISIDDREYAHLRDICDEIFGYDRFVSNISWQRTYSTRNDSKGIVNEVEHILVYSVSADWQPKKLPRTAEMNEKYKNPDDDTTSWTSADTFAPDANTHQGMVYAIQQPITGEFLYPPIGRHWALAQDDFLAIMNEWCPYELKDLHDDEKRAEICGVSPEDVRKGVQALVPADDFVTAQRKAQSIYKRGQWPRFYFTKNGKGGIRRKIYIDSVGGRPPTNFWPYSEVGHTDEAKKEILAVFDRKESFATPKPERLLRRILYLATDPGDLVLDAFLGSGTTAAVAQKMNRRYIGIEMGDHAVTHVVPRLQKVIDGEQGGISQAEKWKGGGGFQFFRLGEPLFDAVGCIRPDVSFHDLAAHIWRSETGLSYHGDDATPLLGIHDGVAYYLLYNGILKDKKPQSGNALTRQTLALLPKFDGPKVVYGTSCILSGATIDAAQITFRKIPTQVPV